MTYIALASRGRSNGGFSLPRPSQTVELLLKPPFHFLRRKEEEGKEEETKREEEENQTPLDPFLDPPLVAPPRTSL